MRPNPKPLARSLAGRRRGSTTVVAVLVALVVFMLCMGILQLSFAVTNRQQHAAEAKQAFYLAEAGLAEAYSGLALAKTGNVGTPAQPATIGDGLFWVEATTLPTGEVELESTALYGSGRVTLGLVAEPYPFKVSDLGFFTSQSIFLNPDITIDSYDSAVGSYRDQLIEGKNLDQAILGSNGDITIASGDVVNGDVLMGAAGTFKNLGGTVTGGTFKRAAAAALPPVEVPPIPIGPSLLAADPANPVVVPPGEHGFQKLEAKDTQLILTGPATIVVEQLNTLKDGHIIFDTSGGPVDVYVTDSVDLSALSYVSSTSDDTGEVTIQVSAPAGNNVTLGAKSTFFGFIYAPESTVKTAAQFEVFGGFVANELNLAAQGKMHMDLNLVRLTREETLPVMWSWRVVSAPAALASKGADPRQVLGVVGDALPRPSQAHQDQWLELTYRDLGGFLRTYSGMESGFDWTQVSVVVTGTRDGDLFRPISGVSDPGMPETVPLTPEEQALVDEVKAPQTSAALSQKLLDASPGLSDVVIVEAINRVPPMDEWDLYLVLLKNGPYSPSYNGGMGTEPLPDKVLLHAIFAPDYGSKPLSWTLEQNSPLSADVLAAAINRNPAMKTADLNKVLSAQ